MKVDLPLCPITPTLVSSSLSVSFMGSHSYQCLPHFSVSSFSSSSVSMALLLVLIKQKSSTFIQTSVPLTSSTSARMESFSPHVMAPSRLHFTNQAHNKPVTTCPFYTHRLRWSCGPLTATSRWTGRAQSS